MLERFTSVHEQAHHELIRLPFDAAPEQGVLQHPEVVPRGQELVSDGVRDHQPLPPQAETLGPCD